MKYLIKKWLGIYELESTIQGHLEWHDAIEFMKQPPKKKRGRPKGSKNKKK